MSKVDDVLEQTGREWRDAVDRRYDVVEWKQRTRVSTRVSIFASAAAVAAVLAVVVAVAWPRDHARNGPTQPVGNSPTQRPPQMDCAAPVLKLGGGATTMHRGSLATITGRYFVAGCQDTVSPGPTGPMAAVPLTLTTKGGRIALATAHPTGELGTFSVVVTVPAHVPAGPAQIGDGGISAPLAVTVN